MRPGDGSANPPSFLLIIYDQLSAVWLEAGLRGAADLPNFARLGQQGTYFPQCFSSNPVCGPARATIATGLRSCGHGVTQLGYQLNPAVPTFMRQLSEAGWHTAACGKVHLRAHLESLYPDYLQYGFREQHITEDPRGGSWLDWVRSRHPEHFRAALRTVGEKNLPEYSSYGPQREDLTELMADLPTLGGTYELPFPEQASQSNWITDRAVDQILDQPAGAPLLCQVGYVQPHNPYAPPRGYRRFVNMDLVPAPLAAEWHQAPLATGAFATRARRAEEFDWKSSREHYFADLVHLDRQLGRMLDALEDSGRAADTYVLTLADHGDLLLDHGLIFKDAFHYDACVRVPLFISGPGLERDQVRGEIVQLEDIYPTILDAAGLDPAGPDEHYTVPGQPAVPFSPGRSLLPLASGKPVDGWRDAAFIESYNNMDSRRPSFWVRTIRTADARYSVYGDGGGEQLFDLAADPDEQINLATLGSAGGLRQQLRDRLLDHLITEQYPHSPRDLFKLGAH